MGAVWGITGVALIIGDAIYRMIPVAIGAFAYPFDWIHWVFLVAFFVFMTVVEGYKGFQLGFSPRVVARARYLARHPRAGHALLAPVFTFTGFNAVELSLGVQLFVGGDRSQYGGQETLAYALVEWFF